MKVTRILEQNTEVFVLLHSYWPVIMLRMLSSFDNCNLERAKYIYILQVNKHIEILKLFCHILNATKSKNF